MSAKEGQDFFAELVYQKVGMIKSFFLDIGCGDCESGNNSFNLEKFGWRGLLIDKNPTNYSNRQSRVVKVDVTNLSWLKVLDGCPKIIGYISLDVDEFNIEVINDFPFDRFEFICMTFETDKYNCGDFRKKHLLNFLEYNRQYKILFEDVKVENLEFEDWIVNSNYFTYEGQLGKSLDWKECLEILKSES